MKLTAALKRLVRPVVRPIRNEIAVIGALAKLHRYGSDIRGLAAHADRMAGKFPKTCPICQYYGPFGWFGNPPRWDARCPQCGSLERHRHLALLLCDGLISRDVDILHFAPEPFVTPLLRPLAKRYVTADLFESNVDLRLNIEEIDLPDACFDVIVCSHVLQYTDDKKALPELKRILRPSGKLLIVVPLIENAPTYEDPTIRTQADRENHFGIHDCPVRIYGSDFRQRLHEAGFSFTQQVAHGQRAVDFGLSMGGSIFVCTH
jgi:SAM-dependent methyltransferase